MDARRGVPSVATRQPNEVSGVRVEPRLSVVHCAGAAGAEEGGLSFGVGKCHIETSRASDV
jgi:hypothetical protein